MNSLSLHNDMVSITRTSLLLDCSPTTIKRWYRWASKMGKSFDDVGLPKYSTDAKGTWYFTLEQVQQLKTFRINLKWGEMADFHSKYYWSKKKG